MEENENLIISSAVLCLSSTTEFARNRAIDTTINHNILKFNLDKSFQINSIYEKIKKEIPIRKEEIENSIQRNLRNKNIEIVEGDEKDISNSIFKISDEFKQNIKNESNKLQEFLLDITKELLGDLYTDQEQEKVEKLLLDCLVRLMSKFGYEYASQITGIVKDEDFIPRESLNDICLISMKNFNLDSIPIDRLKEAIGILFDRRDPCFNSLVFNLCQQYYSMRLMGMDLPIDFFSDQIYKDSIFYLDTNVVFKNVFGKSDQYSEFRTILNLSSKLNIIFAVSELTLAEYHPNIHDYHSLLEKGEELIPSKLLYEVQDDIIETNVDSIEIDKNKRYINSHVAMKLRKMGIKIIPLEKDKLAKEDKLSNTIEELHKFDRKIRKSSPEKNKDALFHDSQLYHMVKSDRENKQKSSSAWFLTDDNSVIAHGIDIKNEDEPPYCIKIPTLLQTLSPFVESQVLKREFDDLFVDLISKELLPENQIFKIDDLKMLVGLDIKTKMLQPEVVRRALNHVKKEILKDGGLTNDNRAEVIYEFTKFVSVPENFPEQIRRYTEKIKAYEFDLKKRDLEMERIRLQQEREKNNYDKKIKEIDQLNKNDIKQIRNELNLIKKREQKEQNKIIRLNKDIKLSKESLSKFQIISGILICSLIYWLLSFIIYNFLTSDITSYFFILVSIQIILITIGLTLLYPKNQTLIIICGAIITIISILTGVSL